MKVRLKSKKVNRLIGGIVTASLVLGLMSTGTVAEAAKKPKLNKTSVKLYVGKTVKLKLKNNKKKVVWSSSNKKVATVSKKGVVKAKKAGTAKIRAKVGKKKYTCKVKVIKKPTVIRPTARPTTKPIPKPVATPVRTSEPSNTPWVSEQPSDAPSDIPSKTPSVKPSDAPSNVPSAQPSDAPSAQPSDAPSAQPSDIPSVQPSDEPSARPSDIPSVQPSDEPSAQPSEVPSTEPTPSSEPAPSPTATPSQPQPGTSPSPTAAPTATPTPVTPSEEPTTAPTIPAPTVAPTAKPTATPTAKPTATPTVKPTATPTVKPTATPTAKPTATPTVAPTATPTIAPTATPTATPSKLTNPVTVTLSTNGQSWNSWADRSSETALTVSAPASLKVTCMGVSNATVWWKDTYGQASIPEQAFTESGLLTEAENCSLNDSIELAVGPQHTMYFIVKDNDTGYYYVVNTPVIKVTAAAATPTPAPTATPTPTVTPTPSPSTGGTAGSNVDLNGKTAFSVDGHQLALGLTKAEVKKILGSLTVDVLREGKSPQGFDTMVFRENGNATKPEYNNFILLYFKNDIVVGITAISSNMSYGSIVSGGTSASTLQANGWSAVEKYETKTGENCAFYKTVNNANIIALTDYYGDSTVYCLQTFSTEYSVTDMTNVWETEMDLDYSANVTSEMATQLREMLNTYIIVKNFRSDVNLYQAYLLPDDLSDIAQSYSTYMAQQQFTTVDRNLRSNSEYQSACKAKEFSFNRSAEYAFMGNIDAVGFLNSVIGYKEARSQVCDLERGSQSAYVLMGTGVDAYYHDTSDKGFYNVNLVLDLLNVYVK